MNICILLGNLTRDPELKYTPSGTPSGTAIASIGIAVNEVWYDAQKAKQERVHFFDCEAWGKTAENIAKFFAKGKPILIQGSLALDTWDDKTTGQKRSKVKVKIDSWDFCGGDAKPREGELPKTQAQRPASSPSSASDKAKELAEDQLPY